MAFVRQRYGKANVRVLRVQRAQARHEVREARIEVSLDGDFASAYTAADNSPIVATDTMKNLVNVLALEHLDTANEPFALAIAECLLDRYRQVAEARVEIEETVWSRMRIGGEPHDHSFRPLRERHPVRPRHADAFVARQSSPACATWRS